MSFFSQIAKAAGLGEMSLADGYNVINYNGAAVYIEGVVRLIGIDEGLMRLELKGAIAEISGENLSIFELSDCLIIKGKITNLNFSPFNNTSRRKKREKSKTAKKEKASL